MLIRRIVLTSLFAIAPLPALSQNLDAGDILNLGNQILRGLQQPQTTSPQQAPAAPQVRTETQTVQRYTAGEVSETQSLLAQLGYDPGPADGVMGPRTERAIRQFQADTGLVQDGRPSRELLVQLSSVSGTETSTNIGSQGVPQPSFDCTRAGNPVEFAICGSVILADKDRELHGAYEQALAQTANSERLRLEQRSWIQQRNRCGGSEACLADAMDVRIGELQRVAATPVVPVIPAEPIAPSAAVPAAPTLSQSEPVASPLVREDGLLVHANGRLIVPGPLFSRGTPEFRQYRALERYLLHAASGLFTDELVPADNPSILAERARDYLPMADVRPYLCTVEEMNSGAADCMSFSDASFSYSLGGGQLDSQGDAPRESDFLWWRGANEFERSRNMVAFSAENGLRDRIIATAPETPVRLVYSVLSIVDSYDFETSTFPILPVGGATQLSPPGSRSVAIDLADVVMPIPASPAAAEALLGELQRRENGDPVIYVGVAVDLTPDQPHAGQPRWTAQTVSSGYFIDAALTRPLESAAALSGQGQQSAAEVPAAATAPNDATSGSVIRDLQLNREDSRVVIDFTGYREPTATAREAVMHIQASAARDIVTSFEEDENGYNLGLLASIVNDETRVRFFTDRNLFAGQDEFAVQRNRETFRSEVAPRLISEAPVLPIPMRLYLAATLGEYDFDKQGFPVRTFQDPGIEVNRGRAFSLRPAFELVPSFLPIPPDAAERLVSAQPSDLRLRIDFQVAATEFQLPQVTMTVRPISVALVTSDTVHFQDSYADESANDEGALADAALRYLGPVRADVSIPEQSTGYPINGIAPGMSLELALEVLSERFAANEIFVSQGVLRAERGVCRYAGIDSGEIENELGTICLVAQVTDERISRVIQRQIIVTGRVSEMLNAWRESFGTESSRSDGAVPTGSIGREFLGWGAEIAASRSALGRAEVVMVSREAEIDITYLSPAASVVVARSDFVATSQSLAAPNPAPSPASEPVAVVDGEDLSILGIRLGVSRDAALELVAQSDDIVYQVEFTASTPSAIDENADAIALANGEWFVLHYDTATEPRKVIGVVRRIRVDPSIPMVAVQDAMINAYGAPTWDEASGGNWTEWHWRTDGSGTRCTLIDWRDGTMFGGAPTSERGDITRVPMAQGRSGGNNRSFIQVADLVTFIDVILSNSGSDQAALSTCPISLDATFIESTTSEHIILMRLVDPSAFAAANRAASEAQPAASFNIQLR